MNLQDLRRMVNSNAQGITLQRLSRVRREGSPPYTWTPGAINAAASEVIHVPTQFPASQKYQPLDSLVLTNNETTNDITLVINGKDSRYVPAGTILTLGGRGIALWHLKITNNGAAATTSGKIVAVLQKEPYTIDKWSQDK